MFTTSRIFRGAAAVVAGALAILAALAVLPSAVAVAAPGAGPAPDMSYITVTLDFDTGAEGWYIDVTTPTAIQNGYGSAGWHAHNALTSPSRSGSGGAFGVYRLAEGDGNGSLANSLTMWYDLDNLPVQVDSANYELQIDLWNINGAWNDITTSTSVDKEYLGLVVQYTDGSVTAYNTRRGDQGSGYYRLPWVDQCQPYGDCGLGFSGQKGLYFGGTGKTVDRVGVQVWLETWSGDQRQSFFIDDARIRIQTAGITTASMVACTVISDAGFDTGAGWALTGTAAISNSVLSLPAPGDYAQQTITATTITPDTNYNIIISATGVTSLTDRLIVSLSGETDTLILAGSGPVTTINTAYLAAIQTGPTVTPVIKLENDSGGMDIGYICLWPNNTSNYGSGNCLTNIIPNGNFDDGSWWVYIHGAVYNNTGGNAWIPYVISATWHNKGLAAVGRYGLNGVPPALAAGEYLILQFDARTNTGAGIVSARYRNTALTNSVALTYTFSAQADYYTYQTDVSQLAGDTSDIEIGFFNNGYEYTKTAGVFIDNVCLFVSTSPPGLPARSGSGFILGVKCSDVSLWLSNTIGIDFPALEAMSSPSIWDYDEWVPWLASRLWVNAGKPLACLLLYLFTRGPALAILNFFDWAIRQPGLIIAWAAAWLGALINGLALWLAWFTAPLVRLGLLILALFNDISIIFDWGGEVVGWLWNVLQTLLALVIRDLSTFIMTTLNIIIPYWNGLTFHLSSFWSGMVAAIITIWNDHLAPFLSAVFSPILSASDIFNFLVDQFGVLGRLALFMFNGVWTAGKLVWSFMSGVAGLPVKFYYAFDDAINGSLFELFPACTGDISNQWCFVLFGVETVNQAIGHSIGYPLAIVGIVLATIMIFWRNVWELVTFKYR